MLEALDKIAARHHVTIGTFGHAGDGNLHPSIPVSYTHLIPFAGGMQSGAASRGLCLHSVDGAYQLV